MPPIVSEIKPYEAIYKFDWFSATGTAIFIAAIITVIFLKMKASEAVTTFGETLNELKTPIYSIGMVLAFAFIANYSGLSATLALALSHTGHAFTFFSPFWAGLVCSLLVQTLLQMLCSRHYRQPPLSKLVFRKCYWSLLIPAVV